MTYTRKPVSSPRLTGAKLKAVVALAENPLSGLALRQQMLNQIGINEWRQAPLAEHPSPMPVVPAPTVTAQAPVLQDLLGVEHNTVFATVADFHRAYLDGKTTPLKVAQQSLQAIQQSQTEQPSMGIFVAVDEEDVLAQAQQSTQRFQAGAPLGPLDGVPVAVKDELDVEGYPTTVGTRFLGQAAATQDATPVARLRDAGAVILGKTNMHEIGIGMTGINPHHGAARNPYNPQHMTSGSSSGSAAAVAAGICPIALGADGGGSIRVPAAFCGVVGLKPTHTRVSEHGAAPLCWSVAHVGPLAATAADAALSYALIAGEDPLDHMTLGQPAVHLTDFAQEDLNGLRVALYPDWFEDAEEEVVQSCYQLLEQMKERGASVQQVEIPHLDLFNLSHLITIVSEMLCSHQQYLDQYGKQYGGDVRLSLALAKGLTSADYVRAQRFRTRACQICANIFTNSDVIITPAAAITAPPLRPDALPGGESNIFELDAIMRYSRLPNLTGLPAITFPAGYSKAGLPISCQLIGRPWEEHLLLRLAHFAEQVIEPRTPSWFKTPLQDSLNS